MKFENYILHHLFYNITINGYFTSEELSNLTGIEEYTDLEKLYLSYNEISDLSPLRDLNKLNYLDVSGNKITNIESLKNLTCLIELYLNWNDITDLSPLYNLPNLTDLSLWGVPVIDKDLEDLFYHNKNIDCIWLEETLITNIHFKKGWVSGEKLNELKKELLISRRKRIINLLDK